MLKNWKALVVPVATGAVLIGCSRENAARHASTTADARPISITGCVSTGIGNQQFMLTNVRFSPTDQPGNPPINDGTGLTEHSQVRLSTDNEDQLVQLVGQTVTITGTLKNDGRNTIGTTGPARGPNDSEPRTNASQQATNQHHSEKAREEAGPIGNRSMNNGTFPEIQVQRVEGKGQRCETLPTEGRR